MILELLGGAGAGKSTATDYMKEHYGAVILQTDRIAHALYSPGKEGFDLAVKILGREIISGDGTLDRKRMADILFRDPEKLCRINSAIHPMVWEEVRREISRNKTSPLTVVETALPDRKRSDIFDEIWYVYTSAEGRAARLMKDRGYTEERVKEMLNRQHSESEYRDMADRILENEGSTEEMERQIDAGLSGKVVKLR